jgi:hypothetical protein
MLSNALFGGPPHIRFKFAAHKAWAAIAWVLDRNPVIDLHALMKTFYFADKDHLNLFRRPVFGATYKAMKFGPVPLEIYEMAKGEPMWLAELQRDSFPWRLEGYHLRKTGSDRADTSVLSDSDLQVLEAALQKSLSMTFTERTAATHGPDWQAADMGIMRYEDMIADKPDKAEVISDLQKVGRLLRL